MCYHVSSKLGEEQLKSLLSRKAVLNADKYTSGHHFHGFSKPYLPVISTLNPEALDFYRWMLIPGWVKEEKDFKALSSSDSRRIAGESLSRGSGVGVR